MTRRRNQPNKTFGLLPMILMGLVVLILMKWQVGLFVVASLLPTVVLAFTGRGNMLTERIHCVTFSNIAAIIPFAVDLWSNPQKFNGMMTDIVSLLTVYVGAAIGYGLIFVGPIIAAFVLQALAGERLRSVAAKRKALVDQWGGELVTSTIEKPPK